MTRKWNVPLTYQPKIEPVRVGLCTQTIRLGRKYAVGDLIRFYVWEGKPYRSKQKTITEYARIKEVYKIVIFKDKWVGPAFTHTWQSPGSTMLARRDGIVPPTGEALRDVLIQKNGKIPDEGIEAQIIRWVPQ